jgi:glycosyltransferase involved in cell wall biosynthesis
MRVLYLNPFSQEVSGPDESLRTLLEALMTLGVEPHIVLPRPGPQVERYQALGARVHFVPLTFLRRRNGPLDLLLLAPRLARGVAAVSRIARRERIDLIHTNMEVVLDGAVASRLLRIPHVLHYRGNTLDRPKPVFDVLTRFWTRTSEKVFCISEATAEIFRRRGLGAKVEVLYNPVSLERFANAPRSADVRRSLGAAEGDLLVGTVGRLHPRKDVSTFLRAGALLAREVPSLRLAVIGSAEVAEERAYESDLRALAAELGIAALVVFAGARRDVPEVLRALDVMVTCSRNEGFGRTVAEAMAASTPVVATAEGAYPELLRDGAGLLAEPAREQEFARAVRMLLENPEERDRAIKCGAIRATLFDARAVAVRVRRVYETAILR